VSADARLDSAVSSAWQRRGLLAWLLAPIALIYAAALAVRRAAYASGVLRSARVAVPVIVVGNVYVGGTGKTPLTIELVRALRTRGWTPGVVSRGYGGTAIAPRIVSSQDTAAEVGDEPLLIASATAAPVAVAASRARAAQALLAADPACDVIVADDGLQHLHLARDVEIALLDERGLGNGWVLPAGPLREPASRLGRVDAIVLHRAEHAPVESVPCFAMRSGLADEIHRLGDRAHTMPLAELIRRQHGSSLTITAAAGIGVPQRFFDMLRTAGLAIEPLPLPDHFDYRNNPFVQCRTHLLLITEKDAVKCERVDALRKDPRIWVVPLVATIDAALVDLVITALNRLRKGPHGPPAA
jgi:tetraacyldisaccharide 4'-kinase